MDYQQFSEIAEMLLDGMNSAIKLSHGSITEIEYAKKVGELIILEIEKEDASPDKSWTDTQVPGLREKLADPMVKPQIIIKLSAPGLVALSSESGEMLKNLAYKVSFDAFLALSGEKIRGV